MSTVDRDHSKNIVAAHYAYLLNLIRDKEHYHCSMDNISVCKSNNYTKALGCSLITPLSACALYTGSLFL
jgi:hypothetical protein